MVCNASEGHAIPLESMTPRAQVTPRRKEMYEYVGDRQSTPPTLGAVLYRALDSDCPNVRYGQIVRDRISENPIQHSRNIFCNPFANFCTPRYFLTSHNSQTRVVVAKSRSWPGLISPVYKTALSETQGAPRPVDPPDTSRTRLVLARGVLNYASLA
jgi:hypothetical protein